MKIEKSLSLCALALPIVLVLLVITGYLPRSKSSALLKVGYINRDSNEKIERLCVEDIRTLGKTFLSHREGLTVRVQEGSKLVIITVSSQNPYVAADICNKIADAYIRKTPYAEMVGRAIPTIDIWNLWRCINKSSSADKGRNHR
jgi:hypothetical protein